MSYDPIREKTINAAIPRQKFFGLLVKQINDQSFDISLNLQWAVVI